MTTSLADQTWAWLQPPLARLIESYTTDPDLPWDDRFRGFLDELALGEANDHPVTAALMAHLERLDDAERQAFLATEAESFAYQFAQQQQPDEQAVRELADQAYLWVVEQLTAEDPGFPAQLANDPELAEAIYAEAMSRLGTTNH